MSTSEITLGAKLDRARSFLTTLQSLVGYKPLKPTESATALQQLIDSIPAANNEVTTAQQLYSDAVEQRQQVFYKGVNSIRNLVIPINAAVKATFGKTSDESKQVNALVQKINGEKPVKIKDGDKEISISQSQRSYGSQAQHFGEIVTLLSNKGNAYDPGNSAISAATLQDMVTGLPQLNYDVTTRYNTLKQKRDARMALYNDLSDRIARAKESIKSQYGIKSTEYALVKGLWI